MYIRNKDTDTTEQQAGEATQSKEQERKSLEASSKKKKKALKIDSKTCAEKARLGGLTLVVKKTGDGTGDAKG